jgi:hypothetical protein
LAGISPNTFKMNWTSFGSKFRFMQKLPVMAQDSL